MRDMRYGMPVWSVEPHQLLVRRVAVMYVGERCFGGSKTEAEREDERRQQTNRGKLAEGHSVLV